MAHRLSSVHPCAGPRLRGRLETVNLHDWIDELCDALDIEDADLDEGLILDVAREAAHNVERPAAPLTTFLLGFASAKSNGDPAETERLAGIAMDLAQKWDRPAGAKPSEESDVEVAAEADVQTAHEAVDGTAADLTDED